MQPSTNRHNRSTRQSKTIGSTSMSYIQTPPPDRSKLSYHLKDFSFSHEAPGLDLQGKLIQELDEIPANFRELEVLILDNNNLSDLQGIQQFQGLKQLSLINNQISDILNVYHLKSLSRLEELDLRGNAIATRPGYKETILLFLKNLRLLDGKTVKAADRLRIPQELSSQYSLLDRLLKNYSEILRLQSVIQKLDMFKELFSLNKNYLMTYVLFDLDKFRKIFNYAELIQEKTRNQFRGDLLADVRTIELEFLHKQDMPAAAQELLSRQSKNIAELTHRIKQKVQGLSSQYSENFAKFDAYDQDQEEVLYPTELFPKSPFRKSFRKSVSPTKLGYQPAGEPETVNAAFNFKNNPFDSVNQSTVSLRSPVELTRHGKSYLASKPVHKAAMQEKLGSSPKKGGSPTKKSFMLGDYGAYETTRSQQPILKSAYQRDLLETYQRQTSKAEEPQDYRRPKSPNDLIQYISPTAQSMSPARNPNPYTMSPKSATYHMNRSGDAFAVDARLQQESVQLFEEVITKRDWEDREDQQSRLTKNLEQKLEELGKIQTTNKDLKIKLKFLQEQNEVHLRVAQDEIDKANEDFRTSEQSRKQLEVEIARLKRNIAEFSTANAELEKHKTLLREEREYLQKYESELIAAEITEARSLEAYRRYEAGLQAKYFRLLAAATDYSQRMKEITLRRALREERELLTKAFSMIKRNRIIGKIIKYKTSRFTHFLNQRYFKEWKFFVKQKRIEAYLTNKRQKQYLEASVLGWKQYVEKRQLKKAVKGQIKDYHRETMIRRGFKGIKKYFGLYGLGVKAENSLTKMAVAKNVDWLKRSSFLKWTKWVREVSIPKNLAINAAYDLYGTNLLKLGLNMLKLNYVLFKERCNRAEMLRLRREIRTTESTFLYWKFDFRQKKALKRQRQYLADQFLVRGKYDIWREQFKTMQRQHFLSTNARQFYETTCKKRCFGVFLEILEKGKASSKLETAFVRKNDAALVKNLFGVWRTLFVDTLAQRKVARLEAIEIEGNAFKNWKAYIEKCHEKKQKLMRAHRLHDKTWERKINAIFKLLKRNLVKGRRYKEIAKRIEEKKKRGVYKGIFIVLKDLRVKGLKKKYVKLGDSHTQVKREIVETEDNINTIDRERLDLVAKVDEISEVVHNLKEENERKKREIERTEEIIRDKEKRQNKLEEEVRRRRDRLDEAETLSKEITVQLADGVRNNERTLELMREEKESYNNAIVQLMADMKEKDRALEEVTQENASIREKKDRYLKDSSQAIDDLKKEIRMVKEGTDTKEQEIRRAIELVQVLERRNQELRSQLHGTVVDLERSTLDFRSRIKNLEQKNLELLNETDKLKFENERRGKEIIELGGTAKKYEYEIEYMKSGPHYKRPPRAKGSSPIKSTRQVFGKDDLTFRDTTKNYQTRPSATGTRSPDELGNLQDYYLEKRKILDQLDQRQDQIRSGIEPEEKQIEEIQPEPEEPPKSQPAVPPEETGRKSQSKRKIEEIKRKLEDLKSNKKDTSVDEGSK